MLFISFPAGPEDSVNSDLQLLPFPYLTPVPPPSLFLNPLLLHLRRLVCVIKASFTMPIPVGALPVLPVSILHSRRTRSHTAPLWRRHQTAS